MRMGQNSAQKFPHAVLKLRIQAITNNIEKCNLMWRVADSGEVSVTTYAGHTPGLMSDQNRHICHQLVTGASPYYWQARLKSFDLFSGNGIKGRSGLAPGTRQHESCVMSSCHIHVKPNSSPSRNIECRTGWVRGWIGVGSPPTAPSYQFKHLFLSTPIRKVYKNAIKIAPNLVLVLLRSVIVIVSSFPRICN